MIAAQNSSAPAYRSLWIPPGLLLIAAALAKAQEPLAFLLEIPNYGFRFPITIDSMLALLLPGLEMLLGSMLLFRNSRWAAVFSILLILFFSLGILAALPAGYLHRCGCLGPEKLDPTLALIKNGIAILLLTIGFLPIARRTEKANVWGAMGAIIGGIASNSSMIGMAILASLMSLASGRRVLWSLLTGLALGFILKLAGFPLITVIAVGFVLYLFNISEQRTGGWGPVVFAALVVAIGWIGFVNPAAPKNSRLLLEVGKSLPSSLTVGEPMAKDAQGRSLLLFLRPDCDECRDWLPAASALARRPNLPPLTGVVAGSKANAEAFQEREAIFFEVRAISTAAFLQTVRRTPLLVLAESGTIAWIFTEGTLPSSSILAEALK